MADGTVKIEVGVGEGKPSAAELAQKARGILIGVESVEEAMVARQEDPMAQIEDAIGGITRRVNASIAHSIESAQAYALTSLALALAPEEPVDAEVVEPDEYRRELLHELATWALDIQRLLHMMRDEAGIGELGKISALDMRRGIQVRRALAEGEALLNRVLEHEGAIERSPAGGPQRWA